MDNLNNDLNNNSFSKTRNQDKKILKNILKTLIIFMILFLIYCLSYYFLHRSLVENEIKTALNDKGWSENINKKDISFNKQMGTFEQKTTFKGDEGTTYNVYFTNKPSAVEVFRFKNFKKGDFISEGFKDKEFNQYGKYNVTSKIFKSKN